MSRLDCFTPRGCNDNSTLAQFTQQLATQGRDIILIIPKHTEADGTKVPSARQTVHVAIDLVLPRPFYPADSMESGAGGNLANTGRTNICFPADVEPRETWEVEFDRWRWKIIEADKPFYDGDTLIYWLAQVTRETELS